LYGNGVLVIGDFFSHSSAVIKDGFVALDCTDTWYLDRMPTQQCDFRAYAPATTDRKNGGNFNLGCSGVHQFK